MLSLIAILMLSQTALAESSTPPPGEFCDSYLMMREKIVPDTGSLKQLMRMLLVPGTIVNGNGIKAMSNQGSLAGIYHHQTLFVQLPHGNSNAEFNKQLYEEQSKIVAEPILEAIKKAKGKQECVAVLNADPAGFQKLLHFTQFYGQNYELAQAAQDDQAYRMLLSRLQPFVRSNWEMKTGGSWVQITREIERDPALTQLMLVMHSDESGKLYDQERNVLPKGFFASLPSRIQKVIVYSCHADAVIRYYGIRELADRFDYYYPKLRNGFEAVYGDRIPEASVRGMLRSARAPVSRLSNERRECQLSLDLSGSVNGVVLTLNDHFIGVIDQSARAVQAFDCRLLSNRKNVLKANYLKNEFRPALGITHAVIQDSKQISYSMELKEFLSMDLKSHLITIGTTGGIQ